MSILVLVLTGCSTPVPQPRNNVVVTTNPIAVQPQPDDQDSIPEIGGTEPGSLLSATPFPTVEREISETGATSTKIRYVSTASDGQRRTEVTGTVFVPPGKPPTEGWRVIAYGHGNTGINYDCGPSGYDDLLNQWLPISALLLNGYLVVMADYEGLGSGGDVRTHPFMDSKTLGHNMVDGVRAARHVTRAAGTRWAAFGGSLGGLATWSANEVAGTYGTGLDLVGAAAWVPLVNGSELPAKAMAGTLTHDQNHLYFLAMMGLKATRHPELNLDDYMRGSFRDNQELLVLCNGPRVPDAIDVLENADARDLIPASPEAASTLTQFLSELAVPQDKTAAPMLVMYADEDELVDQAWVEKALADGCAKGDEIEWELRTGVGHGNIDASRAFDWVGARFDGQAAVNQCPA